MIKNILLVVLLGLVVWMSKDYFSTTLPIQTQKKISNLEINKQIIKNTDIKNTFSKDIQEKEIKHMKVPKIKPTKKLSMLVLFLQQHKFYDAFSYYLDNNSIYNQKILENYLVQLTKINPSLALKYIEVFLDDVPKSMVWKVRISTYIKQGNLVKAISLIQSAKENYMSEKEDIWLTKQLKEVAIRHINELTNTKAYANLIAFLEEMISYDSEDTYYSYELAKMYMKLNKSQEAIALLEELKYDEVYEENIEKMLSTLTEVNESDDNGYKYAIPLQKHGMHYSVNVSLDGYPFRLLLDTGASFIFMDDEKASMLKVVRDNMLLKTAGNDIEAKLCMAESMKVGDLELNNIKVTIAPFKRNNADGLLGMNFFKQFKFFIDQDTNMLYLDPK